MTLPAYAYLEEQGIPYRRLDFAPDTEKGAANVAAALGFAAGQMVKTLVFETGSGELALVMLGGDRSAVSAHLKKALGSRNIRLADPELARRVTGYAVGSIPPFHWQPPGFRSLVDAALLEYAELGVGAGEWGREIALTPADLVAAAGAVVVNLTDKNRPVAVEVDKIDETEGLR